MKETKSMRVRNKTMAAASSMLLLLPLMGLAACSGTDKPATPSTTISEPANEGYDIDRQAAANLAAQLEEVGVDQFTSADYRPGVIRHLVLFRFKDNATAEETAEVMKRFLSLKDTAQRAGSPYIVSIDAGEQTSGEQAGQGMSQGYVVTFASEGDRNYYVGTPIVEDETKVDPAHAAFKKFVGPLLDTNGAIVFDFMTTPSS